MMNITGTRSWRRRVAVGIAAASPILLLAQDSSSPKPVTVLENPSTFILSNGLVTATVSKHSGDLTSLQYRGAEMLNDKSGHAGGYWSHDTTGGRETVTRITIDPSTNDGERGEVSIKGVSGGIKMGHGPGAASDGDFPADIEIRYSLGRTDSGVYTYCTFGHLPEYPAASMAEARFAAKLADAFNWMTINGRKNIYYPADLHQGDKYIYTAVQFDNPAFGWASTTQDYGFWLINPSVEYLSGGPTKVEFLCHRDTTQVAAPIVLNYWRSSHYGGAVIAVDEGEHWTKVIGPFFLYINTGPDPQAVWEDALARHRLEAAKWPYEWVAGVDYPRKSQRATVKGRLALNDSQQPTAQTPNLLVGLTHPAHSVSIPGRGGSTVTRQINWQTDAKHYQFWVHGEDTGQFEIPNVRPGRYTLHAFADGILGEFVTADVDVQAGETLNLGSLDWRPVRHGRQLWDVGIPNRNGSEFYMGDEYADPEISLKYATLFPNDVNYVIGRSDFRKDWFFQHVPHNEDPNARALPYRGVTGAGRATPFSVVFELPQTPRGTATLRLAICGTGTRSLEIHVNDQPAGRIEGLRGDGAITRHSIQGIWYERELTFDAVLMQQGENVLRLIVPAGPINNGVIYDYVRLELDESNPFLSN